MIDNDVVDVYVFFLSSRRRHTRGALVTGVQTYALPISKHCFRSRQPFPCTPGHVDKSRLQERRLSECSCNGLNDRKVGGADVAADSRSPPALDHEGPLFRYRLPAHSECVRPNLWGCQSSHSAWSSIAIRSEERRVGKEGV